MLTLSRAAALLPPSQGGRGHFPRSYMKTVGDGNNDAAQGDLLTGSSVDLDS